MLEDHHAYHPGCRSSYLLAEDKVTITGLQVTDASDAAHANFFLPGGKIVIHGTKKDIMLRSLKNITDVNCEPPKNKKKKKAKKT